MTDAEQFGMSPMIAAMIFPIIPLAERKLRHVYSPIISKQVFKTRVIINIKPMSFKV